MAKPEQLLPLHSRIPLIAPLKLCTCGCGEKIDPSEYYCEDGDGNLFYEDEHLQKYHEVTFLETPSFFKSTEQCKVRWMDRVMTYAKFKLEVRLIQHG